MITAHSGCDRTEDNSIEFIRYALQLPVDAFEVDVRKNSRGELILSHDETQEDAVLLSDAFALLKQHPEKKINCDLKQLNLESDVIKLAESYSTDHQLIFTGDVNPALFRKGAVKYPHVIWYSNIETFLPDYDSWQRSGVTEADKEARLSRLLEQMLDYETAGINWHFSNAELLWEKARSLGIGISVWTVNDQDLQNLWLNRGVENITTRNISQMIRIRDSKYSI